MSEDPSMSDKALRRKTQRRQFTIPKKDVTALGLHQWFGKELKMNKIFEIFQPADLGKNWFHGTGADGVRRKLIDHLNQILNERGHYAAKAFPLTDGAQYHWVECNRDSAFATEEGKSEALVIGHRLIEVDPLPPCNNYWHILISITSALDNPYASELLKHRTCPSCNEKI